MRTPERNLKFVSQPESAVTGQIINDLIISAVGRGPLTEPERPVHHVVTRRYGASERQERQLVVEAGHMFPFRGIGGLLLWRRSPVLPSGVSMLDEAKRWSNGVPEYAILTSAKGLGDLVVTSHLGRDYDTPEVRLPEGFNAPQGATRVDWVDCMDEDLRDLGELHLARASNSGADVTGQMLGIDGNAAVVALLRALPQAKTWQ
jgi:hypothetical protein